MTTLTIAGLKRKAKENTNIVILSIKKDRKYGGYMMKSFTRCDSYCTETSETYFEHLQAIDYMLDSNTLPKEF